MADEYGHGVVGAWNREGEGRTLTIVIGNTGRTTHDPRCPSIVDDLL